MSETGGFWEDHAEWWQREFTDGVDPEYEEQIVPELLERLGPADVVVDIGTGEGQIARVIHDRLDAQVIGLDPSWPQIAEAVIRGGGPCYAQARCSALPLASAAADAIVVCLVFEHIDRLDASLFEVTRVLRPGGRLLLLLNHPLLQTPGSGMIVDHMIEPPEVYWRIGPYLDETTTIEEVHKGVFVPFVHRPLSRYVNGLIAAGLRLTHMAELAPPDGFVAKAHEYEHDIVRTTPRLLLLEAEKPLDTMNSE